MNGTWYVLDFAPRSSCKGSFPNRNRPSFVRARLLRRELPNARGKNQGTEQCFFVGTSFQSLRHAYMNVHNQNRLSSVQLWTHTTHAIIAPRMGWLLSTAKTASWTTETKQKKSYHAYISSISLHTSTSHPPKKKKMTFGLYFLVLYATNFTFHFVAGNLPQISSHQRSVIRESKAVALTFHSPQVDLDGRHQPWTGHYLQYFP